MAKIKTRKEIGEELEAVKAEFEQAQTSFSEELNTVNTALVDAQAQVEKLTTDLAEATAGLEMPSVSVTSLPIRLNLPLKPLIKPKPKPSRLSKCWKTQPFLMR